jgi:hypothetical protein
MTNFNERRALEHELASCKWKLRDLERCETELLKHISTKGFRVAAQRIAMRDDANALCESIRKIEQRLGSL